MELWIRSQDRECLMKIKRADYDYSAGLHRILVDGYKVLVGIYETKERALEVLDEIQRLITDLQYMSYAVDSSSFYSYRPNVYEMPKN